MYHHSVDVARGHMLLFGIGAEALPPWGSRTRWNNLLDGLAVSLTTGPSGHTNSPHPSSREGHRSTTRWSSSFLLSRLTLCSLHAAAASLVHRNSVPSTHMRCMMTASRRASATIAFFIPRCLAIFIAQALSQDHFVERTNRIWAALRRASSASSRLRTAIWRRGDRSRPIDAWRRSVQKLHRLTWIFGSERVRRRWRDR